MCMWVVSEQDRMGVLSVQVHLPFGQTEKPPNSDSDNDRDRDRNRIRNRDRIREREKCRGTSHRATKFLMPDPFCTQGQISKTGPRVKTPTSRDSTTDAEQDRGHGTKDRGHGTKDRTQRHRDKSPENTPLQLDNEQGSK